MGTKTKTLIFIAFLSSSFFAHDLFSQDKFPIDSLKKANKLFQESEELRNSSKTILSEKKYKEADKLYTKTLSPFKKITIEIGDKTSYNLESVDASKYIISFWDGDCMYMLWLHRKTKTENPKFITSDKLIEELESTNENSKVTLTIQIIPAGYKSQTYISGNGTATWIHSKILSIAAE